MEEPDPTIDLDLMEPKRKSRTLLVVLLGLLGAAGVFAGVAHEMGVRQRAKQALEGAREEAAEERKLRLKAEDKLELLRHERDELAGRVTDLEKQVATQSKELEGVATEVDESTKIIADLRGKLDKKDGEVSQEGKRISVNLVDQIMFPSGESALSPRGQEVLKNVGGVLKGLKGQQLLIGGHTDDRPIHTPQFPSNWELSAARAVAVVHYLVETAGVDPRKVAAAAYSEYHPRSVNKAKNRRIEIVLTPMVEVKGGKAVAKAAPAKAAPAAKKPAPVAKAAPPKVGKRR